MHYIDTRYQARRHPVATFLVFLIFGPLFLAAGLLAVAVYSIGFILTCGREV